MHARGRPVIGAIAGLFFGIFFGFTLLVFSVVALDSIMLLALPIAFFAFGVLWAFWAPLGPRRATASRT